MCVNHVIAMALMVVALIGIGLKKAYATNESSYKYGYEQGKGEWTDCQSFDADCSTGLSDCPIGPKLSYTNGVPHVIAVVTNVTAYPKG